MLIYGRLGIVGLGGEGEGSVGLSILFGRSGNRGGC